MTLNQTLSIVVIATLLSGCTAGQEALVGIGIQKRQTFNDNKARVILKSTCDIQIGSYYRVLKAEERVAVTELCDDD